MQPAPALASPVLEGVVNDGFQHQSVTNMRRAPEVEHVYGPQGRVSVTQAAVSKVKRKRAKSLRFGVRTRSMLPHALSERPTSASHLHVKIHNHGQLWKSSRVPQILDVAPHRFSC